MYLILRNPSCLPRIIAEIDAIPISTGNTDVAEHLPFLEAVISEALRLYPPVPLGQYENVSPDPVVLPDATIIKPGQIIMYSALVNGRSPALWSDDADSFRPE